MRGILQTIRVSLLIAGAIVVVPASFASTIVVHVAANGQLVFSPKTVTIQPGDTVEWIWDNGGHDVKSGYPNQQTSLFGTDIQDAGATFSYTFNSSGTYPYFCSPHGECCGMIGAVTVAGDATPTPTPTPSATPTPTANPALSLPRIVTGPVTAQLQTIATGLTSPVDLISPNDGSGRLFVVQQTGKILLLENGQVAATPFLDVSSRLVTLSALYDERGLLGLAFHPGFNDPNSPGYHKLYTFTSEPVSGSADFTVSTTQAMDNQAVIAEWKVSTANPDVVDPSSRREVLRIDHPESNHNGGKLAFRASDGYLYLSIGDGGAANDVGAGHNSAIGNGQDLTRVLGKILRIDPLDPSLTTSSSDPVSANGKYRVPATNPFVGHAGTVAEIYAYGLRNVYRFSFDATNDQLVAGDVGQNNVEEVDVIEAGKNYGWNRKEGTFLFNSTTGGDAIDSEPDPSLTEPIAEYNHLDGTAIVGGFVYRGSALPAVTGKYLFGDFSAPGASPASGRLLYLDGLNTATVKEISLPQGIGALLKGFGQDANGEIYLLVDSNGGPSGTAGRVVKLVPVPPAPALVNLSTRIDVQTGDNVLIGGFIITGSAPKNVMLRGLGPSLMANGQPIAGRLSDPNLTLFDGSGSALMTNDDWMSSPQEQQIANSGIAPTNPKESAIIASLTPGNYTAILSGTAGATGVGVVELYDLDQSASANAVNISTRGSVQTGNNVMIGGFIVGGSTSQKVLVRAIGPELTASGVMNALQDPTLELHDGSGTLVASNDNWKSSTQAAAITATGIAPTNDAESAILQTLVPGNYTAIVSGVNNTTGVALVEVYVIQ